VIGGINAESTQALEEILREFHGDTFPPIIRTTPSTAEMIKYASNSFLAAKISLINEIANICELTPSVDVSVVAMGVGLDNRIGERFLKAGVGFGGSCFKKDVQALASYSESRGFEPMLLRGIIKVNEHQADHVVQLAEEALTSLAGRRVAVLGLSFKPDTDDVREAPSIRIIQGLLKTKANIVACDPKANLNAKAIFGNSIDFADSPEEALKDADCCILVTEWDEFKRLKPSDFVATMRNPIVIDGRRIYDKEEYRKVVKYIGIGLGPHESLGRFPGCRVEA
jgi:UDPglucose 6-dehydrogenase